MNLRKFMLFYVPFGLIFLGYYRNSWFPGGHFLGGKEIWLIFFISCTLLILILDIKSFLFAKLKLFSGSNKYIILLFALFFVSTILFNLQELTVPKNLVRLLDYVLYFVIFFHLVPKFLDENPHFFVKFVLIISNVGFFTALFGILLFFSGFYPDPKFAGTLVSFIDQPNYVVFILNLGIISSIYYFDSQKSNLSISLKFFFIFSILSQFAATLLTLSRGGYIGVGVGLVVYFIFRFRSKIVLVLPLLLALSIIIIPPFFKAKGFASFISRIYLLVPAYYMMTRDYISLLWGYGITNTFDEFIKYNKIYNIGEFHLNNPHNAVVSLILMFGVLFTLVLVIYCSIMLNKVSIKAFKEKDAGKTLLYAFIISTILLLIFQSIFDSEIVIIEFFSLQYLLCFLGLLKINSWNSGYSNLAKFVTIN